MLTSQRSRIVQHSKPMCDEDAVGATASALATSFRPTSEDAASTKNRCAIRRARMNTNTVGNHLQQFFAYLKQTNRPDRYPTVLFSALGVMCVRRTESPAALIDIY
jgi:hypothetical protein